MADSDIGIFRKNRSFRWAVGCLFFLQGLCFASWASRIPSIQQNLGLPDVTLGIILFALPVGSMIALPFSGWLVTKFGSKRTASLALLLYSILLVTIGFADNSFFLVSGLVLFGMAGNISNIAINTQAVAVESKYGRSIMASFHGFWSLAGFTAAGIGTFMIGRGILPINHFFIIMAVIMSGVALCFHYLVPHQAAKTVSNARFFSKPDKSLLKLGFVAFCCMMCEGTMFDWSGIYFQKIVHAEKSWIGAGYTAFMCTMATGRFVADWIAFRFGFQRTIQVSGLLIATGLLMAVIFPFLITAIIGFLIVGFGVSSVIPLVYSEAGKSKTTTPGMALAAVSSVGFIGFLIGPPLIGIIAGLFSLRISFLIIAIIGITVMVVVDASAGQRIRSGIKRSRSNLIRIVSKERQKTYEH